MFIIFSGHLGLISSKHLNEQNWHTLPSLKNNSTYCTYHSKRSIALFHLIWEKKSSLNLNIVDL